MGALIVAGRAGAQEGPGARGPCEGRIVSDIVIRTQGPSFGGVFAPGLADEEVHRISAERDYARRFDATPAAPTA